MVAQHACGVVHPCGNLGFQSDENVGGLELEWHRSICQLRKVLYVFNVIDCVLDYSHLMNETVGAERPEASLWDSTQLGVRIPKCF